MTAVFILDIPENRGIVEQAVRDPRLSIERVKTYFRVSAPDGIVITRPEVDCRHAVWFSFLAGLQEGRVSAFDKKAVQVDPT